MNWIDIVILVIVAWNLFRGHYRGLVLTIASLASYVVGYWTAQQYSYRVMEWWMETPALREPLRDWVYGYLESRWERPQTEHLSEENMQELWQQLPVPSIVHEWLPEYPITNGVDRAMEIAEDWMLIQATEALLHFLVSFFSFILVFLLVKQLVYFAGLMINGVFKLPLLNMANRFGGLIAGGIRGLVVIWLLAILLTPFAAANAQGVIAEGLRQSYLMPWFTELMPGVLGMAAVLTGQ